MGPRHKSGRSKVLVVFIEDSEQLNAIWMRKSSHYFDLDNRDARSVNTPTPGKVRGRFWTDLGSLLMSQETAWDLRGEKGVWEAPPTDPAAPSDADLGLDPKPVHLGLPPPKPPCM